MIKSENADKDVLISYSVVQLLQTGLDDFAPVQETSYSSLTFAFRSFLSHLDTQTAWRLLMVFLKLKTST